MNGERQALSSAAVAGGAGFLVESQRETILCMNGKVPLAAAAGVMTAKACGVCVC